MATFVNVAVIPAIRPDEVATAVDEALALRTRHREATEVLAAAQHELERAQRADVAATAEKIRAGSEPGAISAAVTKAKSEVELAKRNEAAIAVASEAAQNDLAAVMQKTSTAWIDSLDAEAANARERASDALEAFESAVREIGSAASAALWVRSAIADSRWDRPQRQAIDGHVARSSARVSANSQPFGSAEIVSWARELLEPPTSTPAPMSTTETAIVG
jgi:hypothetical protein